MLVLEILYFRLLFFIISTVLLFTQYWNVGDVDNWKDWCTNIHGFTYQFYGSDEVICIVTARMSAFNYIKYKQTNKRFWKSIIRNTYKEWTPNNNNNIDKYSFNCKFCYNLILTKRFDDTWISSFCLNSFKCFPFII